MVEQIKPELVERMVALVRWLASKDGWLRLNTGFEEYLEFRAIVAELPAPVDPDLIEARGIAAADWESCNSPQAAERFRKGENDCHAEIRIALAAIKRGRELERGI